MLSPNVRSTVNEDGVVIMDVASGDVFHSNPIGGLIWSRLRANASVSEIVEDIATRFGVPYAVVEADVATYVAALKEHGLVTA